MSINVQVFPKCYERKISLLLQKTLVHVMIYLLGKTFVDCQSAIDVSGTGFVQFWENVYNTFLVTKWASMNYICPLKVIILQYVKLNSVFRVSTDYRHIFLNNFNVRVWWNFADFFDQWWYDQNITFFGWYRAKVLINLSNISNVWLIVNKFANLLEVFF